MARSFERMRASAAVTIARRVTCVRVFVVFSMHFVSPPGARAPVFSVRTTKV